MTKVNFTQEHLAKLKDLAFKVLMSGEVFTTKLGQPINIFELIHTQTINTLNGLRLALARKIEDLEKQDEWVASDYQQEQLEGYKMKKELVNLIIGWKRYQLELAELKQQREAVLKELETLKESQKTPEEKIKELEATLESLNNVVG